MRGHLSNIFSHSFPHSNNPSHPRSVRHLLHTSIPVSRMDHTAANANDKSRGQEKIQETRKQVCYQECKKGCVYTFWSYIIIHSHIGNLYIYMYEHISQNKRTQQGSESLLIEKNSRQKKYIHKQACTFISFHLCHINTSV